MKIIIAGSRNFNVPISTIYGLLNLLCSESGFRIDEIVSGHCAGVDMSGELCAKAHGFPIKEFLPEWRNYGKSAGPIRNAHMAKYADALLLIWDGESKGSANMKEEMMKLGKPIYEVVLRKHN